MEGIKQIQFEKKLILNDCSDETICRATLLLFQYMKDVNEKEKLHTEFFLLRLKDSEIHIMAKELTLEWSSIHIG